MAKMGRPAEANPKCKRVTVRFTEKEFEELQGYTAKHDQTVTQTIKEAVMIHCNLSTNQSNV